MSSASFPIVLQTRDPPHESSRTFEDIQSRCGIVFLANFVRSTIESSAVNRISPSRIIVRLVGVDSMLYRLPANRTTVIGETIAQFFAQTAELAPVRILSLYIIKLRCDASNTERRRARIEELCGIILSPSSDSISYVLPFVSMQFAFGNNPDTKHALMSSQRP